MGANNCGCIARDGEDGLDDKHMPADAADRPVNASVPTLKLGTVPATSSNLRPPDSARSELSGWQPLMSARSASSQPMSSPRVPDSARLITQSGKEHISKLIIGNRRFAGLKPTPIVANGDSAGAIDALIVAHCTPPPLPWDVIFGLSPGSVDCITSIADTANCQEDDSAAAAIEFAMVTHKKMAKQHAKAGDVESPRNSCAPVLLVIETVRSSEDSASAQERVWSAAFGILKCSWHIRHYLQKGSLLLYAALFDEKTGTVQFLDEHPERIRSTICARPEDFIQSKLHGLVPADEGRTKLIFGNLRAARKLTKAHVSNRGSGERAPFAVVFRSFAVGDDGPLLEKIFDVPPELVASISTVTPAANFELEGMGKEEQINEEERWQNYLLIAGQHLFSYPGPRLIVVFGRVAEDAPVKVMESARQQIYKEMSYVLTMSKPIKAGVADGQLEVIGALYRGTPPGCPPGVVEWLGHHPEQDKHLDKMLTSSTGGTDSETMLSLRDLPTQVGVADRVEVVTRRLIEGNARYRQGHQCAIYEWQESALEQQRQNNVAPQPLAVVLSCASGHGGDPERLFDARPGELLVYSTCGGISGRKEGSALAGLERLVESRPEIPLLIVLGDESDPAMIHAINQGSLRVEPLKASNAQLALDQLLPAALSALECENQSEEVVLEVAAKNHTKYILERLLMDSDVIFNLVKTGKLEVMAALVAGEGTIQFLGSHSDFNRICRQRAKIEKHIKKGIGLGKQRRGS